MYQSVSVSYNFATAAVAAAFMAGVARNPELAGAAPAGGSVSTIPSAPPPVVIPDRYFFNMMTSNLSVVTAGQPIPTDGSQEIDRAKYDQIKTNLAIAMGTAQAAPTPSTAVATNGAASGQTTQSAVDSMFAPAAGGLTADEFGAKMKAHMIARTPVLTEAVVRQRVSAFMQAQGAASAPQLTAGKTPEQLAALFQAALAAI